MHPREQLQIIISNPREHWEQVDIYGLMYALGVSLSPEKESEIRDEFISRFMPWRHIMILMAEDVLCGDTPEIPHYRDVLSFYRSELYRLYPEIFLSAAKKLERHKYHYRTEPAPPSRFAEEEKTMPGEDEPEGVAVNGAFYSEVSSSSVNPAPAV